MADSAGFHDGLCPVAIGDGECRCLVGKVAELTQKLETANAKIEELDKVALFWREDSWKHGELLKVAKLQKGVLSAALEEILNTTPGGTAAWRIADRTLNGDAEKRKGQACSTCGHDDVNLGHCTDAQRLPQFFYQELHCRECCQSKPTFREA